MATTADGSGAPRRASMPVSSSSGSCPPRPSLAAILVQQPSSQEQEEEGHSRDTVTCTPVLSVFRELSLADVQLRDATTPVLPAPEKLPPPPDSPSIKLSPDPDTLAGNNTESQQGKFYKNRPGSQRVAKKKTSKKNIGIAIGDFNGMLRDELNIKEGEEIEIISKDTIVSRNIGWWTGRNSKGKIGIFPSACVSCDAPVNNSGGAGGGANSTYPLEIMNSAITWKQVVGIGGFGKVFRAIYKGEEVAVKVAKATTFDSLKAVQDVIMEAEKFAHLAHINICSLVGVVLVKDVCLVMEYAHGGALSEVLHKNKTSLPIDVITNWTAQIAAGMNYLHHEADPSLIHRDLKTSNILLANVVDPSDLKNNTIKITDFGLAREIEHTTHMSGAGTYPWMAPEVIRTSDFSKKSDVWSFGVVVWELVTGERPYGGLNLFVVAYGVGHGTLSLPIPEGCPQPLTELMEACWHRDYAKRPSFISILKAVKLMECSDFCVTTTHEEFRSMQTLWRSKIQMRFVELKKMEHDLQKREENLLLKIVEQDKKRKELEEEKKKVNEKAEEYNRLIAQFRQQQELLKQRKAQQEEEQRQEQQEEEKEKEGTYADAAPPPPPPSMVRPPRVKVFSFPKLIQRLWGKDAASANSKAKVDSPLPNRMSDMRAFRRITSSPGNSREKRKSFSSHQGKGHKRRSSDEMGYRPGKQGIVCLSVSGT